MGGFSLPGEDLLAKRKREEEERAREMERQAQESARLQDSIRSQMSAPPTQSMAPAPIGPNLPDPGPEPRFGISKFLLGQRQADPKGSATEAYQEMIRRGPGDEGLLMKLGRAFLPGLTRAVSDTYEEKLERLAAGAAMEQQDRALEARNRYQDLMIKQAEEATKRAQMTGQSRENVANTQAAARMGAAELGLMKSGLGANGRVVDAQAAEALSGDPDIVITPLPGGQFYAYNTKAKLQADQFERLERPKIEAQGEQNRQTEGVRTEGRLAGIRESGAQARQTKSTAPGESGSAGAKRTGAGIGATALASVKGDYAAALKQVQSAAEAGEIDPADAASAIDWLNTQERKARQPEKKGGLLGRVLGGNKPQAPAGGNSDGALAAAKANIGGQPNKRITLRDGTTTRTFRTDANGNVTEVR